LLNLGFDVKLFGYEHKFHWTNILSGSIFIVLGFLFVYYRGTGFLNNLFTRFNLLGPFFESQNLILKYSNNVSNLIIIGTILIVLTYFSYKFFKTKRIKL
jgi:hypothetical protein